MTFSYISKQTCGCLAFAMVDNPENKQELAKEIAKCIRRGEVVTRVASPKVRTMEWECPKHKKKAVAK